MGYSDNYMVLPVMKALQVLEYVASQGHAVSLTEVVQHVQLPKTTVFRYLQTLSAMSFLDHDIPRDRYSVGPKFRELAQKDDGYRDLQDNAKPEMQQLVETFQETVNLAVLSDKQVVYLDIVEPQRTRRALARVGHRHPVHSTSLGKAMAAFLQDEDPTTFFYDTAEQRTINTLTDISEFRRHIKQVRERGYAIEVGENEDGVMCIGVPIFNKQGYPIAALSLTAPETRMTPDLADKMAEALRQAAGRIGDNLTSSHLPSQPAPVQQHRATN